jgi:predicted esterase
MPVRAAVESLIPLMDGLRAIAADPTDLNGRTVALRGASLASVALGRASMALHHKLAHVLGGSFGTPHAATHATLLSYTFGFNAVVSPDALDLVRTAWGTPDPPAWLYDLTREIGLPTSLRELGLDEVALVHVADEVMAARYPNPREVTRDGVIGLLTDALHDRRPSLLTRRSSFARSVPEPHGALQVTVRGPPIDDARVVVIALHGRGASADRFVADLERRLGPSPDVAWMAPQARHNTWYPKGFLAPVADNQPGLGSALEAVQALWDEVEARVGRERIALVGFSQGACLLLTWLSTTSARPVSALAFTGGPTPLPDARYTSASGLRLHLGRSARDPWVNVEVFDAGAASFRAAGALVDVTVVPGDLHAVHAPDVEALSREIERLRSGPAA